MADPRGFITTPRVGATRRDVDERRRDWKEVYPGDSIGRSLLPVISKQAGRCMDCGIPFCHQGCPLGNLIPDWNDLVWRGDWFDAIERLHATNNFPEFTGRLCPAPCETACVLAIDEKVSGGSVTIKNVEVSIVDKAWDEGWVIPQPPEWLSGRTVAVVGSGPAGLAAAQQLTRVGHTVVVYERADRIGGLLRYGIPEFKMEKRFLDRRIEQMSAEGTIFRAGVDIGTDISGEQLRERFDAVLLAVGATSWRDLPAPGRDARGVYQAMEYLPQSNRVVNGEEVPGQITASGKNVVIIGGGDTGADCLGTAHRQGAKTVTQLEIMPQPGTDRIPSQPWPTYPMTFRVAPAHEEGGDRKYAMSTKEFLADDNGNPARAAPGRGRVRRREVHRGGGHRDRARSRTRLAGNGIRRSRARAADRAARARVRAARRDRAGRGVPHQRPRRLRRRRRGPRPVPHRLGDRRGPGRRGRRRHVPARRRPLHPAGADRSDDAPAHRLSGRRSRGRQGLRVLRRA